MFFPERIKSIEKSDRVLEIGPGGTPFWRSDVFLEKKFDNEKEFFLQRGYAPKLETKKPVFFFEGNKFPFKDNEFDYVICSHVLEHVDDVDKFLGEIQRISKKGYFEFPLIYYDFIYNFPEHVTVLMQKDGIINWMPKEESGMNNFQKVHDFFYHTLVKHHTCLIDDLKKLMFQGFEWFGNVESKRVKSIDSLVHEKNNLNEMVRTGNSFVARNESVETGGKDVEKSA